MFDLKKYPTVWKGSYLSAACATCAGPGPSECTSCQDGMAFIPIRNNGTEGYCEINQVPKDKSGSIPPDRISMLINPTRMSSLYQNIGGNTDSSQESHLSKWGYQTIENIVVRSVLGRDSTAHVRCSVSKAVWCQGTTCHTSKQAEFEEIVKLNTLGLHGACRACEA